MKRSPTLPVTTLTTLTGESGWTGKEGEGLVRLGTTKTLQTNLKDSYLVIGEEIVRGWRKDIAYIAP